MLEGLSSLLTSDATVYGLIADRIYPLLLPLSSVCPAVTVQTISTVPQYTLDGSLKAAKVRVEFNAWGTEYGDCKAVADAIRNVLDGYVGTLSDGTVISNAEVVNSTDLFDSDARIYRIQTDYRFWTSY